jgi:hypothetical protein
MTDTTAPGVDRSPAETRARGLRLRTILGIAVLAGLALLTTTQPWWTVHLAAKSIPVVGSVAGGALSALSLSELALAAALAIAGPFFRVILAVLEMVIGATVVLTSVVSLAAPDKASEDLVSHATGIAGSESIAALIKSVTFTPWGYVAVVVGAATILAGVFLLVTFRRWPVASRKYSAVRLQPADGPRDAVIDWDTLSEGEDPTAPVAETPDPRRE